MIQSVRLCEKEKQGTRRGRSGQTSKQASQKRGIIIKYVHIIDASSSKWKYNIIYQHKMLLTYALANKCRTSLKQCSQILCVLRLINAFHRHTHTHSLILFLFLSLACLLPLHLSLPICQLPHNDQTMCTLCRAHEDREAECVSVATLSIY